MDLHLYAPSIPEPYVGWVRVATTNPETWMTPDEADNLADNLREAAAHARRGI